MKKKIAILGSTGSIGKNTFDIIKKNKNTFEVVLLTANKNYKKLIKQALEFNVKNILIYDTKYFDILKKKIKSKKIKVFSKKTKIKDILKKKIDYSMCAISGLDGLKPTLEAIEVSKNVGIANKESIICGWNLIKKKLDKYKTNFIPIDSEHFSIWNLTNKFSNKDIDEIAITASGGPFLNWSKKKIKTITPRMAIKHPNWKMGKKISVDSSNLMNKVFEIIEAYRMFDFDLNKYKIIIHPQSYVHAIVKFKNGLIKMILHDTDMKIPISYSINNNKDISKINSKKIKSKLLNKLNFYDVDKNKFPSVKLLKLISPHNTLFDTVLVSANDELVDLFLNKKIHFMKIYLIIKKILNLKEFSKYKYLYPKNVDQIYKLDKYVRLKTKSFCINYLK